jgi:hypothetical protein
VQRPKAKELIGSFAIAILLIVCSWVLGGTKFGWLCVPLVMPGMFLAAVVFPEGAHSDHALMWLGLSVMLNFVIAWTALLFISTLIKNLILRRREQNEA